MKNLKLTKSILVVECFNIVKIVHFENYNIVNNVLKYCKLSDFQSVSKSKMFS